MKRNVTVMGLLTCSLLIAGCSNQQDEASVWEDSRESSSANAPKNQFGFMEARSTGLDLSSILPSASRPAPGISVTAAPGVAFTYRYAFVLPGDAIAGLQEQHATSCEELGISKCRITGMRYKLVDEDKVEAFLEFKLTPELARNFGKDGITAAEEADGMLIDAVIVGTDAAVQIQQSEVTSAQLRNRLKAKQQEAQSGELSDADRGTARREVERINVQLQKAERTRENLADTLTNTPMTFFYRGDEGFALGMDPIGNAGSSAWGSFTAMISAVLITLGLILPWLALLLGGLAVWRTPLVRQLRNWVGPLRNRKKDKHESETLPADPPPEAAS